jgi:AAHS family benzoate transporter-like MFS transporter
LGGVFGPVLTGLIMGSALGANWAYLSFACVGVEAAVLVSSVPRTPLGESGSNAPDKVAEPG